MRHHYSRVAWALLAIAATLPTGVVGAEDPQQVYQQLFGAEEAKVLQTPGGTDDIALARTLLKTAADAGIDRETRLLLVSKAYDLALRFPDGLSLAVDAGKFQLDLSPDQAEAAHVRIVAALQKVYTLARAAQKDDAGEILVEGLIAAAQAQYAVHDYNGALEYYRRAQPIAASVKSTLQDGIRSGLEECRNQLAIIKQIETLKAQIKAKPDDHAAGNALLLVCITELDDPSTAMLYTFAADDASLIASVKLAALDPALLEPAQQLALADWYRGVSEKTSVTSRLKPLARAMACYNAWLRSSKGDAAQQARVRTSLKSVEDLMAKLDAAQPRSAETFAQFAKRVQVYSASNSYGNRVRIFLDKKAVIEGMGYSAYTYKANQRGLTLVGYHRGGVILTQTFDTYGSAAAATKFAQAIDSLPRGAFVIVASCDEPTANFTTEAQRAIESIGGKTGLYKQPLHTSYVCIGAKGMTSGRAIELLDPKFVNYPVPPAITKPPAKATAPPEAPAPPPGPAPAPPRPSK